MFSCEFYEIFKNSFFAEHLWLLLLKLVWLEVTAFFENHVILQWWRHQYPLYYSNLDWFLLPILMLKLGNYSPYWKVDIAFSRNHNVFPKDLKFSKKKPKPSWCLKGNYETFMKSYDLNVMMSSVFAWLISSVLTRSQQLDVPTVPITRCNYCTYCYIVIFEKAELTASVRP